MSEALPSAVASKPTLLSVIKQTHPQIQEVHAWDELHEVGNRFDSFGHTQICRLKTDTLQVTLSAEGYIAVQGSDAFIETIGRVDKVSGKPIGWYTTWSGYDSLIKCEEYFDEKGTKIVQQESSEACDNRDEAYVIWSSCGQLLLTCQLSADGSYWSTKVRASQLQEPAVYRESRETWKFCNFKSLFKDTPFSWPTFPLGEQRANTEELLQEAYSLLFDETLARSIHQRNDVTDL